MNRHILNSKDKFVIFILFLLFAAGIVTFAAPKKPHIQIHYDFTDPVVFADWEKLGKGTADLTPAGVRIKTEKFARTLSPPLSEKVRGGKTLAWRDVPYVTLMLKKEAKKRKIDLLWNFAFNKDNLREFPYFVSKNNDSVLFHTTTPKVMNQRLPFYDTIGSFGFDFYDDALIQSVTLSSDVSWPRRLKLILDQLFDIESIGASSINFVYGPFILGKPLNYYLGLLTCLLAATFFLFPSRFTKTLLVAGSIGVYLISDLPFMLSLGTQVKYSGSVSAWRNSVHDERTSRFGTDFAQFSDQFETLVPAGSNVFFPYEREGKVAGEWNWMSFHHYPRYRPAIIEDAGFIFYFNPREWSYNAADETVYETGAPEHAVKVELIYQMTPDIQLFKVHRG